MKQIFLTLIVALALVSCKKEKTDEPVIIPTEKKVVESRNIADPSDYRKYSYDGQQKLIKSETEDYINSFEHQPGKMIITTTTKSSGAVSSVEEFLLDGKGKTTQKTRKNSTGAITSDMHMTYDAEGYLASVKTIYPNGDETELKVITSGGNAVEEHYYDNAVLKTVTKYSYDPATKNNNYISMVIQTWGIKGLFGKDYTNLCNGYKIYAAAGTLINDIVATNIMDADGYLLKLSYLFQNTGQKREFEYSYNK